ncbi:sensor histidine kinase [Pseudobacteroides cellulosolvens]|nr:HAMP domain-containing sensor histidine kinase [Pseudobacteroides cellulosolvens]
MFKRLRLKLTLTNTIVTGLIFLFLLSGVYVFMKQSLIRQSENMMRSIAINDRFRYTPFITRAKHLDTNYFFVMVDSVGNIVDISNNLTNTYDEISLLVDETMKIDKDFGNIKIEGINFRFLKSYSNFRNDLLKIVYFNTQPETQMLKNLLTIIITVGTITVLITFLASLFMANRALIPVKKSWERQKDFVADASHELRTPLAVVQTNLELVMINKKDTIESQLNWLDNIKAENVRMTNLVNDLLFIARSDSNETQLEMSNFPLDIVCKETAISFKLLCEGRNIDILEDIQSNVNFYGSEARIKQLITILTDNAVKYTPSGGHIKISLRRTDTNVEVVVSDTGVGIPKEHHHKIFDRFYRVDSSRSSESGGSGLGLSIAKIIVKEHHGHINVNSAPGQGSHFYITLPLKRKVLREK